MAWSRSNVVIVNHLSGCACEKDGAQNWVAASSGLERPFVRLTAPPGSLQNGLAVPLVLHLSGTRRGTGHHLIDLCGCGNGELFDPVPHCLVFGEGGGDGLIDGVGLSLEQCRPLPDLSCLGFQCFGLTSGLLGPGEVRSALGQEVECSAELVLSVLLSDASEEAGGALLHPCIVRLGRGGICPELLPVVVKCCVDRLGGLAPFGAMVLHCLGGVLALIADRLSDVVVTVNRCLVLGVGSVLVAPRAADCLLRSLCHVMLQSVRFGCGRSRAAVVAINRESSSVRGRTTDVVSSGRADSGVTRSPSTRQPTNG